MTVLPFDSVLPAHSSSRRPVREIIGRSGLMYPFTRSRIRAIHSVDRTRSDYAFWDKLRRGQAYGYEFSGLFVNPIAQIISSWVIGTGYEPQLVVKPQQPDDEKDPVTYTNKRLLEHAQKIQGQILQAMIDYYALGDLFIITNPDGSITIPSPDTVDIEYHPLEFRKPIKYTITTRLPKATIKDEYTLYGRKLHIQWNDGEHPEPEQTLYFENLIGVMPVAHFHNDRGVNELTGRSVAEPMLRLLSRYDDLLQKALDGAELMGNPIPTLEGLENPAETINLLLDLSNPQFADEYQTAPGDRRINFDVLPMMAVGKGGSFKYASPGNGFTNDITQMLKTLFLLILEHTRIPETNWGNEMSGAQSTSHEQMATWYMHIEGERLSIEGDTRLGEGLLTLYDVFLRYAKLKEPHRIVVAPIAIKWGELSSMDETMQFQWATGLFDRGALSKDELLRQSKLVEDVPAEMQKLTVGEAPALPIANTAETPIAQMSEGNAHLRITLSLEENVDLIGLQNLLKQRLPDIEVKWIAPDDMQIALLDAPAVTKAQAEALIPALKTLTLPEMALSIGSVKPFDNLAEYQLNFRISKNADLDALQAQVVALAEPQGIKPSLLTTPGNYAPVLTMGNASSKPPFITYQTRIKAVPDGIVVYYDNQVLWSSEAGGSEPTRPVPEPAAETVTRRQQVVGIYHQHLAEMGMSGALIAEALAGYGQRMQLAEAISATQSRFESAFTQQLMRAYNEKIKPPVFVRNVLITLTRYARQAYIDGYTDSGLDINLDDTEDEDAIEGEKWLSSFVNTQEQYVQALADKIYEDDVLTEDELRNEKPLLWWSGSVLPAYNQALLTAAGNARIEWVLGATDKHCPSCLALAGQVRTAKFWLKAGVKPRSRELSCHGYRCLCDFKPTNKKKNRGALPQWRFAEIAHNHSHQEIS